MPVDEVIESDEVELTGFDGPLMAECIDCDVSINGGAYAADAEAHPGDLIRIRMTSADEHDETRTASVTVGETQSDLWSVTTTDWEGLRLFTSCDQSGRFGPSQSQCDNDYGATNLEGEVTVEDGYQYWTVPSSGVYRIRVKGARGGDNSSSPAGEGAIIEGDFALQSGQTLRIVVGQIGGNRSGDGDDGGGGTFVTAEVPSSTYEMFDGQPIEPIVVAGGGAGGRNNTGHEPGHARTWSDSDEGGDDSSDNRGGPGGGLRTDAEAGVQSAAGQAFINGAVGGQPECSGAGGGFGGGGGNHWGSNDCSNTPNGGGGFEGGDAGFIDSPYELLGGGSYVNLDYFEGNLSTSDGAYDQESTIDNESIGDLNEYNYGYGEVEIDLVN